MSRARKARAPVALAAFIPPCLAKLADEPPTGPNWAHEIKLDGYRIQARLARGSVQLLTRSGLDWTERFTGLASAFMGLGAKSAILDGEVVVEDDRGVSDFAALVGDLKAGYSGRMRYAAFDLLALDGADLRTRLLLERKQRLSDLFERSGPSDGLRYVAHLQDDGPEVLKQACLLGLEGIISKRLDRPYRSGRTGDWVKAKCVLTDEFVIAGFLASTVVPEAIGALVVGYYDEKRLVYAGRVGTGFTQAMARRLWRTLQAIRSAHPPFPVPLDAGQARGVTWVRPTLVAQVQYRAWTGDGLLRHASFKAMREDKPAHAVTNPRE